MSKKFIRVVALTLGVAVIAACGGSDTEGSTPTTRVENALLIPTTTAATNATLPSKGSAGTDSSTTVASATTVAAAPTTLAPVVPAVVVADPGNYQATYLATNDPLGSPRPALPAEASLATNSARTVSTAYRTDTVLTVTAAEWVGTTTPMTLRWTISTTAGLLPCDNCAFVSAKAKRIIKEVTSQTLKGSGVKSIRGLDPTTTQVGAFNGNGWGVEFLVGEPASIDAGATGNSIRDYLLGCTGTTASTCKNVTLGAAELKWRNAVWSTSDCVSALRNGGPRQIVDGLPSALSGATDEGKALINARSALDRVAVATPAYRPVFTASGTTRTITGFASTGCAS